MDLTPEQIETAIKLREKDWSWSDISAELGLPFRPAFIRHQVLAATGKPDRRICWQAPQAMALLDSDLPGPAIAAALGVDVSASNLRKARERRRETRRKILSSFSHRGDCLKLGSYSMENLDTLCPLKHLPAGAKCAFCDVTKSE